MTRGPVLQEGHFSVVCEHCTTSLTVIAVDEDEATGKIIALGWQAWRRQLSPTREPFLTFNCWSHHDPEDDA